MVLDYRKYPILIPYKLHLKTANKNTKSFNKDLKI